MKRSRTLALGLLIFSVAAMAFLGFWNFTQARRAAAQKQTRWVRDVSDRIRASRARLVIPLDDLQGRSRSAIREELFSQKSFAGAFLFDTKTHEFERWVKPSFNALLRTPDSRLVIAQLKATKSGHTQTGPFLILAGQLYCTAVVPINARQALGVIQEIPGALRILDEESEWAHLHAYVYDEEGHLLYANGDLAAIRPVLAHALAKAASGTPSGTLKLAKRYAWQWLASFHSIPDMEWMIILTQPVPWVYFPLILFLISVVCMVWLSGLPWKASEALRRAREADDLKRFAMRVDHFVRGKDIALSEPPYPFRELTPIVQALRWLMPQYKKAEAFPVELGLERRLLSLLIESLPEGILFFTAQGTLQLGNELGKVFLALQQDAGKEFKMSNGIQIPRGFLEPYCDPVFTGEQKNLGKEVEVGWADGKHLYRIWVEAVEVDDKVEGYIVVVRDITFRKQWEYVQEQVLSGITHDLRGPISAIMGYLDLLRRQLKAGPPKAVEYVGLAREAGVRLTQMVTDILDVVRFEQGKVDLEIQAVRVDDIFSRIQNIFGVTAGQKGVKLQLQVQKSGIQVYCDPKMLERILDNLVGNAIKFTPQGGTITVTAQRGERRSIFEVSDTGRGIPKEAQSRIFDKFQQVRPGDRSGGYGLGLAVCKFITEAHKGEIRVESEVNAGSRFTFYIPDQPVTPKAPASLEASPDGSVRS